MKSRFLCLVFASASLLLATRCSSSEPEPAPLVFVPGQFTSAERCGSCHKDIYSAWRTSLHANSFSNSNFRRSLGEAVALEKEEARHICLTCHAPTAAFTNDFQANRNVTREGVTCDFCHSLKATNPGAKQPFEISLSLTKFGPVQDAASNGHAVAFSPFHTSSLHCAGCHEYTNRRGLEILTTYEEWKAYRDKGGSKNCQECHMPVVAASIVDPKVKRVEGAFVNLHEMPGGHSLYQLTKSLRMRILELNRTARGLQVKIRIHNAGAGHRVPTGVPTRKVILTVQAQAGGKSFTDTRVYQRRVLDKGGTEIRRDSLVFLEGDRIASDTRIAPYEERIEEFLFPIPPQGNVKVNATLTYLYSPHDSPETETRIDFWKETRELLNQWQSEDRGDH